MVNEQINILQSGGIGVIATDTLYGVVGQALNRATVERIYTVKERTPTKPFIILIHDIRDIELFGIPLTSDLEMTLARYWPGPVSIILDCDNDNFEYLHRGTKALAFRLPNKPDIQQILKETGPLVAPSANPEGLIPAEDIEKAKKYFGNLVDFYSEGAVTTKPSKIIKISDGNEEVLRD